MLVKNSKVSNSLCTRVLFSKYLRNSKVKSGSVIKMIAQFVLELLIPQKKNLSQAKNLCQPFLEQ